ncbi:MAG: DUF4838 domain-containing protein [Victivallales bacterium]|nr:DUF4838 domain-containing protein [Victivallales bacterium]
MKKGIVVVPDDFKGVDWVEKVRAAGLNTLGMHSGGGAAHDIFEVLGEYGEDAFRQRVKDAGLDLEYELHASRNLMPEALFETHPEYFMQTLRSLKRVKGHNWCVTNPDALAVLAENGAEIIRRLPSTTNCNFLWASDTAGGSWCNCRNCTPLSPSEQNLTVFNAVARRARQDNPDAKVCYLAYYDTMDAPRLVKPEPNVICEFAPYQRSFEYAICDSRSAANRKYMKHLLELLEIFGADKMHILEYWLDGSLYGQPGDLHRSPFNREIAEEDIRFYTSLGIRNITTFAVRMDGEYLKKHGDREFQEYAEILAKYE